MSSELEKFLLTDMHFFPDLNSLTRIVALVSMGAGVFELLRRITTCLVLVALLGIYAMPLAAALSLNAMDCCAAGMCPMPGRGMSHQQSVTQHQTHEEMPDCDGMARGATRKCDMGARNAQKVQTVNVGLFVLSAPMKIVTSAVQSAVLPRAPIAANPVSRIPETPPPQIVLS
jgi:hypothetical protein